MMTKGALKRFRANRKFYHFSGGKCTNSLVYFNGVLQSRVGVIRYLLEGGKSYLGSKQVKRFSEKSKASLSRVLQMYCEKFGWFITLTYHKNQRNGRLSKNELHKFLLSIRRYLGRHPFVWVVEFQKRGAFHYHLWIPFFSGFSRSGLWSDLPVRDKIRQGHTKEYKKFGSDCKVSRDIEGLKNEELNLYKMIVYYWCRATNQLGDRKAVLASVDMAKIFSSNYILNYARKYGLKYYQKKIPTGVSWVGRFWGSNLNSNVVAADGNIQVIGNSETRVLRKWLDREVGKSKGNILIYSEDLRKRFQKLIERLKI